MVKHKKMIKKPFLSLSSITAHARLRLNTTISIYTGVTMNKLILGLLLTTTTLVITSCERNGRESSEVVQKRYIHKYGYDLSPTEWKSMNVPGNVVTTLRNGVVASSAYEDGKLHGKTTHTHPHSQILSSESIYEKGRLIKKTSFNVRGVPEKEEIFLSPSRVKVTSWYRGGSPMQIEEIHNTQLVGGEYFDQQNKSINKVINGKGQKVVRDVHENIICKADVEGGHIVRKSTFYASGMPHMIFSLSGDRLQGEKKVFSPSGEPVLVESYNNNNLNGNCTYYQNGFKYLEVEYISGIKNGEEKHFIDGSKLIELTNWQEGQKHGPSTVYFDDMSQTKWFFNHELVSKEKYRELCEVTENMMIMNERSHL